MATLEIDADAAREAAGEARAPLDHSLVSGIGWTALFRWTAQPISWLATLYAARALEPSDFGLYSMAGLGIGLVRLAEGFGMDAILVQDRSLDARDESRLAGLVLAFGAVLYGLFFFGAPLVAGFFDEPQVTGVIRFLAALIVLDAIQVVPKADLQRRLEFRKLAIATFVQFVTTAAVLALSVRGGLGYWSLVTNLVAGTAVATVLLVWWAPYRVGWPGDIAELTRPLKQGWRVLVSRLSWYGYSNADQAIIGRVLGTQPLGAYSFALQFSTIAQEEVGAIVTRVVPGIFSEVQHDVGQLKRYYLGITEFLAVASFPVSIGMALVAERAVGYILGAEWGAVVVPLQLLCVYSTFLSAQTLNSHVLMWTGRFRAQMWLSVWAFVYRPLTLYLGARYGGLPGVGWAWVLGTPIGEIPSFWLAFRRIGASVSEWLRALAPASAACAAMACAVLGLERVLPTELSPLLGLALAIGVGAVTYAAVVAIVYRRRIRPVLEMARAIRAGRVPVVSRAEGAAP